MGDKVSITLTRGERTVTVELDDHESLGHVKKGLWSEMDINRGITAEMVRKNDPLIKDLAVLANGISDVLRT